MRTALLAAALALAAGSAHGADVATNGGPVNESPTNESLGTRPTDELPPDIANGIATPGDLDGLWRLALDNDTHTPLADLDIAHATGDARAGGVFTALPGLCPPVAAEGTCDFDGSMGEITDIVLIDGGLVISFNPGFDIADEQVLRLKRADDGSWRGTLDATPPRRVVMRRP